MTNNIFLYSHGGSGNHGCEALARTTQNIIGRNVKKIYSFSVEQDKKYNLDDVLEICEAQNQDKSFFELAKASMMIRLLKNDRYAEFLDMKHQLNGGNIAVSIGGDNYCYPGFEEYCFKNKVFNENGVKTALWGCSIEPDMINDVMKADLADYTFISARESITYNAIKPYNPNTFLFPDPAFTLEKEEVLLPTELVERKFIGINLSPVVIDSAKNELVATQNFSNLIRYIIENTEYSIALIPHVVWTTNDDRKAMKPLLDEFIDTGRIVMINDCDCMKLKGIISQCEMFIGARTHATIAAYSTCVPTLVVGYSVKAKGIAKDIFGTYDNYVIPVQSLTEESDLTDAFIWLNNNKADIKSHLESFMPSYIEKAKEAGEKFREVFGIEE